MIKAIAICLFTLIAINGFGQVFFSVSNENPCPGEWITFSISTLGGCTNPLIPDETSINLTITPTPDFVDYSRFHGSTTVVGITAISVKYNSSHTVSVNARYNCNGGSIVGNIAKSVVMRQPLAVDPAISGLDGLIYSNDPASTATASITSPPSDITYAWTLSPVSTSRGSITSAAIANPASATTAINWPQDYVGDVNITATATSCATPRSATKLVSVRFTPDWSWGPNSLPAVNCAGSVVGYHLQIFNGFTLVSATPHLSGAGNTIPSSESMGPQSAGWSVQWNVDGAIWADFTVKDQNNRMWNFTTETQSFDVADFDQGQLADIPFGIYCGPMTFNLSQTRSPSGSSYVYQYCNTGNCSTTSPDWIDNASASFPGVTTNTSFRMKLTETRCGTFYSNVVSAIVKVAPSITASDKVIFSGGTYDIPSSNQAGATVTVAASAAGVNGASNLSLSQGSSFGTLATQMLTTSGPTNGSVTYAITPSNNGCTGSTSYANVAVYKMPQIYSNRTSVYKGLTATLSTDPYDSYLWQTADGQALATSSTYQTNVIGSYKVVVMKSGLTAVSDIFTLGGQFTGVNENYIITRVPQKELNAIDGIGDKTEDEVIESIQYFDGIGRPSQTVNTRMSPSRHDIVQPTAYDQYGREAKKYLPYVSLGDNGRIQPNAIADQPQFYSGQDSKVASDPSPFAESRFEPSPLNRIVEQGAPGTAWQIGAGHTISKDYLTNGATDVLLFNFNSLTGEVSLLAGSNAYYQANVLICNKTTDEQGNDVLEYVDKLGRTVCKKVKSTGNTYACTYYVYDDLGNLVVVLPPEGVQRIINGN